MNERGAAGPSGSGRPAPFLHADRTIAKAPRPAGIRLLLALKCAKAPLMFALAIWLTFAPQRAVRLADALAFELSSGGATATRIGAWIREHATPRVLTGGAVLAWLDG